MTKNDSVRIPHFEAWDIETRLDSVGAEDWNSESSRSGIWGPEPEDSVPPVLFRRLGRLGRSRGVGAVQACGWCS